MTTEEEIRLRLGFDASAVMRGTQVMMDQQKKAAADYVGFWKTAIKSREEMEIAADVRAATRANRAAALRRTRDAVQMERQAAIDAEIAGGSIPANLAGMAGGGAMAGGAVREVAKEAHGFAGIMRETAVLFREGFRGNFTRMIGSMTILIGMLGTAAAAVALPLAAILAIPGYRTYKAFKEKDASAESLKEKVDFTAEGLRDRVRRLAKAGLIGPSEERGLMERLSHPDAKGLQDVFSDTNYLLPRIRAAEAAEKESKIRLDYAKRKEEAADERKKQADRDIEEGQNLNHQYDSLSREARHIEHEANSIDQEAPTIGDLAGRRFTKNLNAKYGAGGIFDVGAGNGPFAKIAQNYELAQKQQLWDITHGNAVFDKDGTLIGGAAYGDKQRQIAAHNLLAGAGLDTPAMKLEDMRAHLGDIQRDMATVATAIVDNAIRIHDAK